MAIERTVPSSVTRASRYGVALLAATLLFFAPEAVALPFPLQPEMENVAPLSHTTWLEDPDKSLTVDDVSKEPWRDRFRSFENGRTSQGVTRSAYWLRLVVVNNTHQPISWIAEASFPLTDYVDAYLLSDGAPPIDFRTGDHHPLASRPVGHDAFAFPFVTQPGSEQTLYIRFEQEEGGTIDQFLTLWTDRSFVDHQRGIGIWIGAAIGMGVFVFLYHLIIAVTTRSPSFFWYSLYLFAALLNFLGISGVGPRYFWGLQFPFADDLSLFVAPAVVIFAAQFSRAFLQTQETAPTVDRLLLLFIGLSTVPWLLHLFGQRAAAVQATGSIALLLSLFTFIGGYLWFKGRREARIYTLVWSTLTLTMPVLALRFLGFLPTTIFSFWGSRFSFVLQGILLSLALADQINLMRKKREEAEEREIRMLANAKAELERNVADRTADLHAAKEMAEKATRMKDQFIALVSHDLRSPLFGITGVLGTLRKPEKYRLTEEEIREGIISTHESAKGLNDFVTRVLDVNRLQSGAIRPRCRVVPTLELVREEIVRITPMATRKGVTFRLAISKEQTLFCDPSLVGQVIGNLLSNAVKFSHRNGAVVITAPDDRPGVLAVIDEGSGVPSRYLPDLFRHEVRTSGFGTEGEKGTGLGLPHCADIIQAHGGALKASSVEGEGATFTIELPAPTRFVLVVDDQPAHRQIMKEKIALISDAGVMEAEDGNEALALLKETRPALLITDLEMEGLDGFALIRTIREREDSARLPIIVSSSLDRLDGYEEQAMSDAVISQGADGFIAKPITEEAFVRTIRPFLQ